MKSAKLSEYKWDVKLYDGHILAIQKEGKLLAYSLGSEATSAVRIFHTPSMMRGTIKGFSGACADLAWAYGSDPPMLGCVDKQGNLFVHAVIVSELSSSSDKGSIQLEKILELRRDPSKESLNGHEKKEETETAGGGGGGGGSYQICWCPYVPEKGAGARTKSKSGTEETEDNDDEVLESVSETAESDADQCRMVVLIKGKRIEILMIDSVLESIAEMEGQASRDGSFARLGPQDGYAVIEETSVSIY